MELANVALIYIYAFSVPVLYAMNKLHEKLNTDSVYSHKFPFYPGNVCIFTRKNALTTL